VYTQVSPSSLIFKSPADTTLTFADDFIPIKDPAGLPFSLVKFISWDFANTSHKSAFTGACQNLEQLNKREMDPPLLSIHLQIN
jgi:hypothetical protein